RHLGADQGLARTLLTAEDRLHRPALVGRQRSGLDDAHPVTDAALILLVVRFVAHPAIQILVVLAVPDEPANDDHHGLVHLVGDDHALALLPPPGVHFDPFCTARR